MQKNENMKRILLATYCLLSVIGLQAQTMDPVDVTGVVANAKCQNAPGWQHHSGEQAGTGGSNYCKQIALFNSTDYSGAGIESWTASPVTSNTDLIFQDVTLAPGRYRLSACAVAMVYISDTQAGASNGGIFLKAGNEQVEVKTQRWKRYELEFNVTAGQETVRIGLASNATNRNTWLSIADVHLTMTEVGEGASRVALDEHYDTYPFRSGAICQVSLNKYFPTTRLTTLCLPFNLTEAQCQELFSEVKTLSGSKKTADKVTFTLKDAKTIEAGKCYLVRGKADNQSGSQKGSVIDLGVQLITAQQPAAYKVGVATLQGTFRQRDNIKDSYILSEDGTSFVKPEGRGRVPAYGWFIK